MKSKPVNSCFQVYALIGKFYKDFHFMLTSFLEFGVHIKRQIIYKRALFFQFYNWIDNKSTVSA